MSDCPPGCRVNFNIIYLCICLSVYFYGCLSVYQVIYLSIIEFICGYSIKSNAIQWKNWGNELHKERKYDLMVDYYTLALEFTQISNIEVMASLLSNRCLALNNLKKFKEALEDAEQCIKIKPKWFRVSN